MDKLVNDAHPISKKGESDSYGYFILRSVIRQQSCSVDLALGQGSRIKKIKSCFFKADESKMVNGVSVSAAVQHIEVSIKRNH